MNIGIIGAGRIGGTLGKLLSHRAGHSITYGVRDPNAIGDVVGATLSAGAATPAAAAKRGEVVILAVPFNALPALAPSIAGAVAGKVVIDATNAYPQRDGPMAEEALRRGSGLSTAALLPGACMVKAFNTLIWTDLSDRAGDGVGMALAGDDADAVRTASGLIEDAGFVPVAAGALVACRRFDPGQPAYGKPLRPDDLRDALSRATGEQA